MPKEHECRCGCLMLDGRHKAGCCCEGVEYYLVLDGGDDHVKYTVGSKRIEKLAAKTYAEAKKEADRFCLRYGYEEMDFWEPKDFGRAVNDREGGWVRFTILEVAQSVTTELSDWLAPHKKLSEQRAKAEHEEKEKAELDRLKKKYEG